MTYLYPVRISNNKNGKGRVEREENSMHKALAATDTGSIMFSYRVGNFMKKTKLTAIVVDCRKNVIEYNNLHNPVCTDQISPLKYTF